MTSTKKLCISAACIALCYALPVAFHAVGLGTALSPMHLPVLLCGLLCGWSYGAVCGIVGPVLSSLLTGMPGAVMLIHMVPELCVYGLCAGLLMKWVHTGRLYLDLYLSLVPAMLLGRIAGGVARALFYLSTAQPYSLSMWAGAYLVGTTPAAVLQLALLPTLVVVLTKSGLVPDRGRGGALAA